MYGLNERERLEKQSQSEMVRQAQADKELERQIEAKRNAASTGGTGSSTGLILVEDHLAPGRETASSSAAPPASGEGLLVVTDHLAPPAPVATTATEKPPAAAARAQDGEGAPSELSKDRRPLDERIAAARQQQRKLREALEGTPSPAPPRPGESPRQAPSPALDPEGFRLVYEGGTLVRKERDVNGDGKPDILRYYDGTGSLVRQEEDSRLEGRIDTWTFYEVGGAVRKESDTNRDGRVDLWAFYDGKDEQDHLVRTEADSDHDGHRDRVILYAQGQMVEEQRYSPGLDPPSLRITYVNGQPTRKEEDTNSDGRMDRLTEYDDSGRVTKISRNPAGEGIYTLVAYYGPKPGEIQREEEDLNGDGGIDVIAYYQGGRLARREFFDLPEVASLKSDIALPQLPSKGETP
jgi:antitoxin component YwqK of YwqJK toxin-antitoxin module